MLERTIELLEQTPITRAGLVDLDASYLVMLGLFLFLFYMLNKGFLSGLLEMFDRRHELTDGARMAAADAVTRAEARITEYEARVGETRREAANDQKRLRSEAQAKQIQLLEEVRGKTDSEVAEAVGELNASAKASETELTGQANQLGKQIAARILGGAA